MFFSKNFFHTKKFFNLFCACFLLQSSFSNPNIAQAQQPASANKKYSSFAEISAKAGNNRNIGMADLFINAKEWNDSNSLLFLDIRGQADNKSSNEYNLGVGYRQLFSKSIWGGYLYYDQRKSNLSNDFNQITAGAERLSDDWDFRVNGYLPIEQDDHTSSSVGIVDNKLQVSYSSERALKGADLEVGHSIPLGHTRAFISAYYFPSETNNGFTYEQISGQKLRIETKFLSDMLALGAEYDHNDRRGDKESIYARFRVPFGGAAITKLSSLERRMTDTVIRDIDIITDQYENQGDVTLNINGVTSNKIIIANSSDANDLQSSITGAGDNSVVVINGQIKTSSPINLNANQVLLSGDSKLAISYKLGNDTVNSYYTPSGTFAGSIINSSTSNPTITISENNNAIVGMNLDGGSNAIYVNGSNISNLYIQDVVISNFANSAILVNASAGGGSIEASEIEINSNNKTATAGIYVSSLSNADFDLSNSKIDIANSCTGVCSKVSGIENLGLGEFTIDQSSISVKGYDIIAVYNRNSNSIMTINDSEITATANNGVVIGRYNALGGFARGVHNAGVMTINDSEIIATGGAGAVGGKGNSGMGGYVYGIYNSNNLTINNSEITATAGNGGTNSKGSGGAGGTAIGLASESLNNSSLNVEITNSKITALGGNGGSDIRGINSKGGMAFGLRNNYGSIISIDSNSEIAAIGGNGVGGVGGDSYGVINDKYSLVAVDLTGISISATAGSSTRNKIGTAYQTYGLVLQ